ncbi:MAG TPA: acetylornithine/succinylornithine family transaminase [Tepidisphaeraceae bacterium]
MADTQDWLTRGQTSLIQNYGRAAVVMVRGEGSHVWDSEGRQYLDLFAGFGGCVLGHCHPALVAAATEQAGRLWHVGNALYTTPQIEFAEKIRAHAFDGRAFFCHSGLEANEAAVKLARLRGLADSGKRWKTISLTKSFHGRSLAMIAATGNNAVKEGFGPAVPGFANIEAGDLAALREAIDDETAAVLLEPIQGEGGINEYAPDYVRGVRRLCDENNLTMIFDEVWTGCGRTGRWFAHQWGDVEPDIMTLGKAVGGGLPVGVMYAKPHLAALLTPGKHGSTLGGNPICMSVSRTIFDVIEKENLVEHAEKLGTTGMEKLRKSLGDKATDVRGHGLFIGVELKDEPQQFGERALEKGLIINLTARRVIRLAPPINISQSLWDEGISRVIAFIESL